MSDTASQTTPTIHLVHDRAEFDAAVADLLATGGEIQIATDAEPFKLHIWGQDPVAEITVTSEDPSNMSHVTSATVYYSSNFNFDSLIFDPIETTGINGTRYYNVQTMSSDNLDFTNNVFEGGATGMLGIDDPEEGCRGPLIRSTTDVTMTGNTFTGHLHALTLMDSSDIQLVDNEFTKMQGDGIELAGAQNVLIESNIMHDMYGTANDLWHGDMIQYWTAGTTQANSNIIIRDNYMNAGDVSYQGIFGQGTGSIYRPDGLIIENNTIITGGPNGIYLNNFDNVEISNNTILANPDAQLIDTDGTLHAAAEPRIILQDVNNALVQDNIGLWVENNNANLPNSNVVNVNNLAVDYTNPEADNYVDKIFVNAGGCGENDVRDFQQLDTSPYQGIGSTLADTMATEAFAAPDCVIEGVQIVNDGSQQVTYSIYNADPSLTYVWTFADGSQSTGSTVTKFFRDGGMQTATIEALSGGQVVETIARTVGVTEAKLVQLDFDTAGATGPDIVGASIDKYDSSNVITVQDGPDGTATNVYVMDGSNPFEISRSNDFLQCLDEFSMVMDMRRTDVTTGGAIVSLPFGLELYLNSDGSMKITVATSNLSKVVNTVGLDLMNDTDWHSIGVSYSSEDGEFSVRLDDAEIFSIAATGILYDGDRSMQVGSRFGIPGLEMQIDAIYMVDYATDADSAARDADAYLDALAGTVVDPDPSVDPALPDDTTPAAPAGESLADMFADTDAFWVSSGFEGTAQATGTVQLLLGEAGRDVDYTDSGVTGQGLDLEGQRMDGLEISRDVDEIHSLDEFTLAASVQIDAGSGTGDLIYLPKAFRLRYVEGLGIEFQLATDEDGDASTADVNHTQVFDSQAFEDGAFHRLVASYDGAAGTLSIYVDGAEIGSMQVSGLTPDRTYYGLSIGSKWQDSANAVLDDFVFADKAVSSEDVAEDNVAFTETLYGPVDIFDDVDEAPSGISFADMFATGSAFWVQAEFEGAEEASGSVHLSLDSAGRDVDYDASGVTGQGLDLEGQGHDGLEVSRDVDEIHSLDEFTVAASVQIDDDSSSGDLIYLPKAFRMRYVEGQGIEFQLATDEDGDASTADVNHTQIFATQALEDGEFHRLVASYDSDNSLVTVYVDGVEIGNMQATGLTPDRTYYGMSIGSKWQDSASAVMDDFVFANQSVTEQHVIDDHAAFVEDLSAEFDAADLAVADEAILDDLVSGA